MADPETRRAMVFGLVRAILSAVVLLAVYFIFPLDVEAEVWVWIALFMLLALLIVITVWQIRAIVEDDHPGVRGVQAIAIIAPLFLIIFAAVYYVMAESNASNFNAGHLTRVDSLYFALTILVTTGFGDIYAASQVARITVMIQMLFDLLLIGVIVKLVLNAIREGQQRRKDERDSAT